MNDVTEQVRTVEQTPAREPDGATWQTPSYEVVDTALEVTAYSLSSR
ncbi:pyrroloquinoline quinone precursor peptide PqqA [Streptomyces sp. NPDC101225]